MPAAVVLPFGTGLPAGEQAEVLAEEARIRHRYLAAGSAERENLLRGLFDQTERLQHRMADRGEDTEAFVNRRAQLYTDLLLVECRQGAGLSPALLTIVVAREVGAGRMALEDPLVRMALSGELPAPRKAAPGLLGRLFGLRRA